MLEHPAIDAEAGPPTVVARVVVGYDGSPGSAKALDWAIEEARRRPAVLEIVTAWLFPMAIGYAFTTTVEEVHKDAQGKVDQALAVVAACAPELNVHGSTSEFSPGPALVKASCDADLLVVGSRGLGGFRELLLGSVSTYCARHATCSVAIIR